MNIVEISERFPTDVHVVEWMEIQRWGDKAPLCPYCDSKNISNMLSDFRRKCYACNKTGSVTVNTFLHNTRLPLKTWLFAFSIVTDAKKGLSALQLQRNLNISYPTSFKMYHAIREMMSRDNKGIDELDNVVEMDETYVGGKPRKGNEGDTRKRDYKIKLPDMDERIKELREEGFSFKRKRGNPAKADINPQRGRGTNKIPVVGIVERNGDVVAEVMRSVTGDNIREMVKRHVDEDDSVIITDEYSGYKRLDRIIEHISIDHQKLYSYKGVNTNTIESFWAIIKRGIIGQYHQVSPKYLPNYIAEFVFKYNNRNDDDMFETLVKMSMTNKMSRAEYLIKKYSK